jgi:hypothetical protein
MTTYYNLSVEEAQGNLLVIDNKMNERESWILSMTTGDKHLPVIVNKDGKVTRQYQDVHIGKGYLDELAASLNLANANFDRYAEESGKKPYRFPIIVNHIKTSPKRYGDKMEGKVVELSAGKWGYYERIRWTKEAWKEVQDGTIQHVSIGVHRDFKDDRGEEYSLIAMETSLTAFPVLSDLGTIQEHLSLRLAMEQVTQEEDYMEELAKLVEELSAKYDALNARIDEMVAEKEEPPAEPEMEAAMDEEEDKLVEIEASATIVTHDDLAEIKASLASFKADIVDTVRGTFKEELRLSRLNTSELGTSGNAPELVNDYESAMRAGRAKGYSGMELARFVEAQGFVGK